ncbi:AbgT family transporter [Ornithinimicrobium flavum]|uniref:AbgT family transporter n=1 Tax=Ornithinimicrobium flavum TaxID=1288636 RepID=UPI001305275F|nr:AbgT family transporter [Ornithinimicrobium flavum]
MLVLFFAAAQFIAWFSWSNLGTVLAVGGASLIDSLGVPPIAVILLVVLLTYLLKWVTFFVLWYVVGLPLGPGSPVR